MFEPGMLRGKSILVTGASSGLGRDYAVKASELGATVIGTGRNEDALADTLAMLSGDGHSMKPFEISSANESKDFVMSVAKEHGPLFGVFHAAGMPLVESIKRGADSSIDRAFDASYRGMVGIVAACARKAVIQEGGRIVIMSSASATKPIPGLSLYGSVKAAISQYTASAVTELAPRGVTINCINAANVVTELHAKMVDRSLNTAAEEIESKYPLGFGAPEDVSNAVNFLMSPGGRWITGASLQINGGFLAT